MVLGSLLYTLTTRDHEYPPPPLPAGSWGKSWLLDVWQLSGKESRLDTSCRVVHLTGNHIGHSQLIKQNCLTSV